MKGNVSEKDESCSSFSGRKFNSVIRIGDSAEIVGEEDFKGSAEIERSDCFFIEAFERHLRIS
jgi:hypothetical protein